MTTRKHYLTAAIVVVFLVAASIAVTADGDAFGEGFSSFDSDVAGGGPTGPELSGSVQTVLRAFPDVNDIAATTLEAWPVATVRIGAQNDYASLMMELRFDNSLLSVGGVQTPGGVAAASPVIYLDRLVREASVWIYGDAITVEAGLLRRVWGKGDELHVVDVLNPTDLSDPGRVAYVDALIPVPMVVVEVPFRSQGLLELACVPYFVPDAIVSQGRWMPSGYAELVALAEAGVTLDGPPRLRSLENFQAGMRVTDTFGPLDAGLLYYYGYLKQPSIDLSAFVPLPVPAGTISLDSDRVHVAGGEAAAVLGPLNLRGEAAFYATADMEGTDAAVANPGVRYLGGFDVNLPVSSLNLNVQVLGVVTLGSHEIESNGPLDFEFDADGVYTSHFLAGALRDTWFGEQLTVELSGGWYVETGDFVVRPAVTLGFGDDVQLGMGGTFFAGDAGTFLGQFDANDFIQADLTYRY